MLIRKVMKMSNENNIFLERYVSKEIDKDCFARLEKHFINVYRNCYDPKSLDYKKVLGSVILDLDHINHLILILQQYDDFKSDLIGQSLFDIKYCIENIDLIDNSND